MPRKKKEETVEETPLVVAAAEEVKTEASEPKAAAADEAKTKRKTKPKPASKAKPVAAKETQPDKEGEAARTGGKRAEKIGVVFSDKMTNTVVVRVDRLVKHSMYRKYMKRRKKFMAHDTLGAAEGDKVRIVETRPMSKRKRWRVIEIIHKAEK